MPINDQLDDNAADLRSIETNPQPLEDNSASASTSGSSKRSVSKGEIILGIGIVIGFIIIVYVFLQSHSTGLGQNLNHPDNLMPKVPRQMKTQ